jgi:hypothetical protein
MKTPEIEGRIPSKMSQIKREQMYMLHRYNDFCKVDIFPVCHYMDLETRMNRLIDEKV